MLTDLRKISDVADRFMSVIVFILSIAMLFGCVLQVFTRYILNDSLSWTEELARYAFIAVTMVSASTCTKNNSHATITFLIDVLPKKVAAVLTFLGNFFVCFASVVIIRYGVEIAMMTKGQVSTALHISKSYLYYMVVLGGVGILFQTVINMLITLCELFTKKEDENS